MKPEIPMKSGFWQDALTKARHIYCYLARPGVNKKAKREYHKAVRRKWKRLHAETYQKPENDRE